MGTTHKTGCVLCAKNCDLEVNVEDNRIGQSDQENNLDNLRTEGKKIELLFPELADWSMTARLTGSTSTA